MEDQGAWAVVALILVLVVYAIGRSRESRRRSAPIAEAVAPRTRHRSGPATVLWVIDGDTVDVRTGRRRLRVRLDSIDCPEDGQEWGDTAKFGLIKLIGGKSVYLEDHGVDHYGRTLATIYVSRGRGRDAEWMNVNERMVALGHAWVMRRYYAHLPAHRRDSLDRIEAWARSRRVGLWRSPDPMPPWIWRASDGDG